jgi:hypothetical protein
VEKLKGKYSGQKPIALVKMKTTANIPSITAAVPVNVPVKYNTPTTRASTTLMILSIVPIFVFIAIPPKMII